MLTNKEIYQLWAPKHVKWSQWVRPVPFVSINMHQPHAIHMPPLQLPCFDVLNDEFKDAAVIVDMPGTQSVEIGLSLIHYGYMPVPIYNGTQEQNGSMATTDNHSVLGALQWGASILSNVTIDSNARPAFLVDSNRLHNRKLNASIFDNSWDVYHQDLPTEDYFLKANISKIVIIGEALHKDLKKIFANYPKKKISIYITDGYSDLKCIKKGRLH